MKNHLIRFMLFVLPASLWADGLVMPRVNYKGSLNEKAQEAILIFRPGSESSPSSQDMILKISVEGEASEFGWVVPLPSVPETGKADPRLFKELHDYVQSRVRPPRTPKSKSFGSTNDAKVDAAKDVEVIKREIVGNYDVAIVKENTPGTLLAWLKDNGYRAPETAGDLIAFYRSKKYVFACMKVSDAALKKNVAADLHPIRFTFSTGGRDGIFFPMRMTGLQEAPFDLNLYVFYDKWINDKLSKYGFTHRDLRLRWRDYDSRLCTANAGKLWSNPKQDVYLKNYAKYFPTVTRYMKEYHPGRRFYLTNLYANRLRPAQVLDWSDDLWMFPYYTDAKFVPYDARKGGPAAWGY